MRKPSLAMMLIMMLAMPLMTLQAHGHMNSTPVFDYTSAKEYCDSTTIDDLEGIWEFPDDETDVMICRSQWEKHSYDIIVLSSPDCRLGAGSVIGHASRLADANKFKVSLYTRISSDAFSMPGDCLGELSADGSSLMFHPKKIKFSLRSISILPKFWRMIRVKVDNPLDRLARGLVKTYPSGAGKRDGFDAPIYF